MATATDPSATKLFVSDLMKRWPGVFTDQGIRWLISSKKLPGGRLRKRKDKRRPYYSTLDAVRTFERTHPRLRALVQEREAKDGAA